MTTPSGVRVQPEVATAPEVWLLGSSDYSGALAAQLGLAFSFAHFINPRGGEEVTQAYKASFRVRREPSPRCMVCTFAICGENNADGEAACHRYTHEERQYVIAQRARAVIGGPERSRQEIEAMAARYGADEVMVLTITGDYASRLRSYERLIGAF